MGIHKIYDLDDPVIVKLSHYTLTNREKECRKSCAALHNRPFYVNCTFSEFKEKYNTIHLNEAYLNLSAPTEPTIKNLTIEEPCLEILSS